MNLRLDVTHHLQQVAQHSFTVLLIAILDAAHFIHCLLVHFNSRVSMGTQGLRSGERANSETNIAKNDTITDQTYGFCEFAAMSNYIRVWQQYKNDHYLIKRLITFGDVLYLLNS